MDYPEWAAEWTRIRVARSHGKWPHELDELDLDEYHRILAYEQVIADEANRALEGMR